MFAVGNKASTFAHTSTISTPYNMTVKSIRLFSNIKRFCKYTFDLNIADYIALRPEMVDVPTFSGMYSTSLVIFESKCVQSQD